MRLELATTFKDTKCIRYEAMNGGAKCSKCGGFGTINVMGHVTIRYSTYDFLFNFHRKYAAILTYPACI